MPNVNGTACDLVKILRCRGSSRTRSAAERPRPTPAGRCRRPSWPRDQRGRSAAGRARNTSDRAARTPGSRGTPNSRIASRPPGRSTRASSRHATSGCCTLRMPKAIVAASTDAVGDRQAHRVAAHQRDAARLARPRATLSRPSVSIAPAKSTPTTRAAPPVARAAPSATSAVPVQTSSSVSRPVSCSDAIARAPPAPIEAGAEQTC